MKYKNEYRKIFERFFEPIRFDDDLNSCPVVIENPILINFNVNKLINLFNIHFEKYLQNILCDKEIDNRSKIGIAYFILKRIAENILNHTYASEHPYYTEAQTTVKTEMFFLNDDFNEFRGLLSGEKVNIWEIRILELLEEYRFVFEALSGNKDEADKINPLDVERLKKLAKHGENFNGKRLTKETIEAYKNIFKRNEKYQKQHCEKNNYREIAFNIARIELKLIHIGEQNKFYNSFKQFRYKHNLNDIDDFEKYLKENGYYT